MVATLEIDNSGNGNCLYYAYSISLMYFLRARNNDEDTQRVFGMLQLTKNEETKLQHFLAANTSSGVFSDEEHKTIEAILGPKTRDLATKKLGEEFKKDPYASALYATGHRFIAKQFQKAIKEEFQRHIEIPSMSRQDEEDAFAGSDFYKHKDKFNLDGRIDAYVEKTKENLEKAYQQFTGLLSPYIDKITKGSPEFTYNEEDDSTFMDEMRTLNANLTEPQNPIDANTQKKLKDALNDLLGKTPTDPSYQTCKQDLLRKISGFTDSLTEEYILHFFVDEDYKTVHEYQALLSGDCFWGTEEMANILHSAITEEYQYRKPDGGKEFARKLDLSLEKLTLRGNPDPRNQNLNPHKPTEHEKLILVNKNQGHWVSKIPFRTLLLNTQRTFDAPEKITDILTLLDTINNAQRPFFVQPFGHNTIHPLGLIINDQQNKLIGTPLSKKTLEPKNLSVLKEKLYAFARLLTSINSDDIAETLFELNGFINRLADKSLKNSLACERNAIIENLKRGLKQSLEKKALSRAFHAEIERLKKIKKRLLKQQEENSTPITEPEDLIPPQEKNEPIHLSIKIQKLPEPSKATAQQLHRYICLAGFEEAEKNEIYGIITTFLEHPEENYSAYQQKANELIQRGDRARIVGITMLSLGTLVLIAGLVTISLSAYSILPAFIAYACFATSGAKAIAGGITSAFGFFNQSYQTGKGMKKLEGLQLEPSGDRELQPIH